MQVRAVGAADRAAVLAVEAGSTPGLRYLEPMFAEFQADCAGEFMLVEDSGQVIGCAKFTVLPDGSAWLEALRVSPEAQGRGAGKAAYERFFQLARAKGIGIMRMYTGRSNVVSAGLAGRFGFTLRESFQGFTCPVGGELPGAVGAGFEVVRDAAQAEALLMPLREWWGEFVVLNRTFYEFTPALCAFLAREGMVYARGQSVVVAGARFRPLPEWHVGLFAGDAQACLAFAAGQARQRGAQRLCCLHAVGKDRASAALAEFGFKPDASPYIVMQVTV